MTVRFLCSGSAAFISSHSVRSSYPGPTVLTAEQGVCIVVFVEGQTFGSFVWDVRRPPSLAACDLPLLRRLIGPTLREPTKFSEGSPPIYSGPDAFKIWGPRTESSGVFEVLAVPGIVS